LVCAQYKKNGAIQKDLVADYEWSPYSHDKKSERVGNRTSTQLVGSCHDKKSERAGCIASTQQDSTFQLIVGFKQYNQSLTRKSRQRRSFVDNVLINSWQCQMEINNVKPQSIDSWECYININKVDLKLLLSCLINHSWQCRSDFDITLSFVDQSSSTFQLVVASSNNNTLSFDDSVDWSSATINSCCLSRQNSQIDWQTFHCIKLRSSVHFMQHTPLVDC